jgi:D-alanyl-D-alanine carboxypeptidase
MLVVRRSASHKQASCEASFASMITALDGSVYRAMVERGEIIWQDANATRMPWWSLSKTAIAAAALALVQRGRLTLDEALSGQSFTLRHLLQHTSGLPDYGGLAEYHQAVAARLAPWSRQELFDRVESQRLRSIPGEQFAYSNVGYLIVRSAIEDATGLGLGDALDELVFRPLNLENMRVASLPADLSDSPLAIPKGYHPGWVFHGLVLGTPAQAALFLSRLLGGNFLDAALLKSMRERFTISEGALPNRPWNSAGYGMGLMIDVRSPFGPSYGHTGAGPGSTTATYWFEALPGKRTVSVFAGIDDQGIVEREVLALAKRDQFS